MNKLRNVKVVYLMNLAKEARMYFEVTMPGMFVVMYLYYLFTK